MNQIGNNIKILAPLPLKTCAERLRGLEQESSLDWRIEVTLVRANEDMWTFQVAQTPQLGSKSTQEPLFIEGFLQRAGADTTLLAGRINSQTVAIGTLGRNELLVALVLAVLFYGILLQVVPGFALALSLAALFPAFLAWRWWSYGRTRARLVSNMRAVLTETG